jgi:hypothetical protein
MAKCKKLMLKHIEIDHLLAVIENFDRQEVYWGRVDHFYKRHNAVKLKLEEALKTKLAD